ncbi:hypothetical protein FRC03_011882 [Tulasnella sp. 419]|nr:hypothetical protein FRC03_011882 [Tulasnella sp. 419]
MFGSLSLTVALITFLPAIFAGLNNSKHRTHYYLAVYEPSKPESGLLNLRVRDGYATTDEGRVGGFFLDPERNLVFEPEGGSHFSWKYTCVSPGPMNGNRYHSNMRGYLVIAKKWDSDDYGCEAKGKFALQSSGDPKVPPSLMFQGTGKVHSIVGDFYLCRDKRIYYSDPDRLPEECLPKREVLMYAVDFERLKQASHDA